MQKLLLGTTNAAKAVELRRLVRGLPLTAVAPWEVGLAVRVDEQGASHRDVAIAKAEAWSRVSGMRALASDGGLVVPALGDAWDSLLTHRFGGGMDDGERARELLRRMEGLAGEERRVSWREAVAVAERGALLVCWEVESGPGLLVEGPGSLRLAPGFWVAGLWWFPQVGKTYDALDEAERRLVGDHWTVLRDLVQEFFRGPSGS